MKRHISWNKDVKENKTKTIRFMKRNTISLTESELRGLIRESVRNMLIEGYNQFSDDDFASDGDPYDLIDDENQFDPHNLEGQHIFNHLIIDITGDGTQNPSIHVTSGSWADSEIDCTIEGKEAQTILDKIHSDMDSGWGSFAIYKNIRQVISK